MISLDTTRQKLFDLLVAKGFDLTTRDAKGKETTEPKNADLFSFNYKVGDNSYGTVVVTVNPEGELEVYYGDVLGKGMDSDHKKEWYDFLYQLRHFSKRNMLEFSLKHMNKLKYSMQTMAQVSENREINESKYYGFKKTSYTKQTKEAKLKIVHSKPIDEEAGDQRYRNVASLYVETSEGERFKLPFTKLYAGRAMARHVSEGGNPYDSFGTYICELVSDINTLGAFTRYARGHNWQNTETAGLAERGLKHFGAIKRKVKSMIGKRGYHKALEAFDQRTELPEQETMDKVRELFTEKLLDTRVESALPVLTKLELEGKSMKEVNEFEQWAESTVQEGFDPEEFEGKVTVPGPGGFPTDITYTAKVDNEQNTVHVTKCSNEQYRDECQDDAEEEWADRDVDVPMEAKEYECPTCRGAGDYRDEEHKKHDCPDCEGEGKYVDEGKMKDLAMDMKELSDKEFEEKYQTKKSDWSEVKTPGLRQDPKYPAYIGKMKTFAGDIAAEAEEKFTQEEIQKAIRIAMHMKGDMTDATDAIDAIHPGLTNHPEVDDALKQANESVEVTEQYAPSVGDQIVTGKGTKGTVETVTDEAVEFRTETGKLLKTAISNVEPDAVNEDDVEEGNEFTLALANAKRDGKDEFEVDGKVYKVEESQVGRIVDLVNYRK